MICFVLFPQACQPSMNFNISELVNSTVIETGVDLVLIQLFLLSYVNHVVPTSILQA